MTDKMFEKKDYEKSKAKFLADEAIDATRLRSSHEILINIEIRLAKAEKLLQRIAETYPNLDD